MENGTTTSLIRGKGGSVTASLKSNYNVIICVCLTLNYEPLSVHWVG